MKQVPSIDHIHLIVWLNSQIEEQERILDRLRPYDPLGALH